MSILLSIVLTEPPYESPPERMGVAGAIGIFSGLFKSLLLVLGPGFLVSLTLRYYHKILTRNSQLVISTLLLSISLVVSISLIIGGYVVNFTIPISGNVDTIPEIFQIVYFIMSLVSLFLLKPFWDSQILRLILKRFYKQEIPFKKMMLSVTIENFIATVIILIILIITTPIIL